jgi:hypothetical protein
MLVTVDIQPAIAYTRRDLSISRDVGDERSIASSLINLASIYCSLLQLSEARGALSAANAIAEEINDPSIERAVILGLAEVENIGRNAGLVGRRLGPRAECACESGKEYQDCCGLADFEPVDFPTSVAMSADLGEIDSRSLSTGRIQSLLDVTLRHTEEAKLRSAWTRMHGHDGWFSIDELPDASNMHLAAARALLHQSQSEPDSWTGPIAVVLLASCALEAFINQVSFWLLEARSTPGDRYYQLVVPLELQDGPELFQRQVGLTEKWSLLGKLLLGDDWPPREGLWQDFKYLISLRNELVHFKSAEFEQVLPTPKRPSSLLRGLPQAVEIREVPRSWPYRILTASLAEWAVGISTRTIEHFRVNFANNRGEENDVSPSKLS